MSEWKVLDREEERMVRRLGHDPGYMMVNRVGEGHWAFLDLRSRMELYVSRDENGAVRGSVYQQSVTPPKRAWMK